MPNVTEIIIPVTLTHYLVKVFIEDSPGVFRNWLLFRSTP